jgi:hypothetical protein
LQVSLPTMTVVLLCSIVVSPFCSGTPSHSLSPAPSRQRAQPSAPFLLAASTHVRTCTYLCTHASTHTRALTRAHRAAEPLTAQSRTSPSGISPSAWARERQADHMHAHVSCLAGTSHPSCATVLLYSFRRGEPHACTRTFAHPRTLTRKTGHQRQRKPNTARPNLTVESAGTQPHHHLARYRCDLVVVVPQPEPRSAFPLP